MAPKFVQYQYPFHPVANGNKHDFQPTGETYVMEYVYMGACCTDTVDEYRCTKCGLDANHYRVRTDDCTVA